MLEQTTTAAGTHTHTHTPLGKDEEQAQAGAAQDTNGQGVPTEEDRLTAKRCGTNGSH